MTRDLMMRALWIGWGITTLLLWFAYANVPPCPDHATFDYVGWIAASGGHLYVDVIEQNWPGAMWLHTLSTALFGNHLWSFRTLDYGLMLLGAWALHVMLKRAGSPGSTAAAWIVVPLYQAMYVAQDLWFAGQRDVVGANLLLVGAAAYQTRILGGGRAWCAPLGAVTVIATMLRPTYLVFPGFVFVLDLLLTKRHARSIGQAIADIALAAAVAAGLFGVLIAYGSHTGGLTGWYEAAVLFNTQLYSQSSTIADASLTIWRLPREGWHWFIAFALAGLVLWWRRGERLVLGTLGCLFALGLLSFYVQLKGFEYHLGAWLPVLAALIAELLARVMAWAMSRRTGLALATAALVCAIALGGSIKKLGRAVGPQVQYALGMVDRDAMHAQASVGIAGMTAADMLAAAAFAASRTTPSDTVLVWGRAIGINFLAQRRLPVPFATIGTLEAVRPPFVRAEEWIASFEQLLQHRPPQIVFLPGPSAGAELVRYQQADAPRAVVALRAAIAARYRKVAAFGPFDAHVLVAATDAAHAAAPRAPGGH